MKWISISDELLGILEPYSDWFFGPKGIKGTKNPELKKKFRAEVDIHYGKNLHHAHKIGKPQPIKNQLEALAD